MPKVNFTKVEDALKEGMRKISVDKLIELADDPKTKGKVHVQLGDLSPNATLSSDDDILLFQRSQLCTSLLKSLDKIAAANPKIWQQCGLTPDKLQKAAAQPEKIKDSLWQKIKAAKEKVEKIASTADEDEKIIQEQIKVHKNKRYNVNKKWLPLH